MATVSQVFAQALQHHQAGRLADAEGLYRRILAVDPNHSEALHLLGLLAHGAGRNDLAVEMIRRSLVLDPTNSIALSNLGEVYRVMGQFDEALVVIRRALELQPHSPEAVNNLGNVLRNQGQLEEAAVALRRAVQLKPDYPAAYSNLGIVLAEKGKLDEAIPLFQRSLQLQPRNAAVYNNLGNALRHYGELQEAVEAFRRALQLDPNQAEMHNNLGTTLIEQGRIDEAAGAFRRALELKPDYAQAQNNLGNTFKDQGLWDAAISAYRRAVQMNPGYREAQSNIIYTLNFVPTQDDSVITEEQQRWNRQFAEPAKELIRPHDNDRNPERRLRVGYVSPDFWGHVVGRNLVPLFRCHDQSQVEIICYSGVVVSDPLTDAFRERSAGWRNTIGMTAEKLAEMIRQDGVDILVDLSQHMANNRLDVFVRQPAPVQVSFAGYPGSTGVDTIQYRISDRYMEWKPVDGGDGIVAKEKICLIDSFWCYEPCEEVPINPLPARESGRVTLGCLNSFCKMNEPLLKLWARILTSLPGSSLVLLSGPGSHCKRMLTMMAREGIEGDRIEFVPRCPHRNYLELHHRLDMVLDPFPYSGHTTSLDALWMGVPVVTLVGRNRVSRAGLSQLSNLGLEEFAVWSKDEYVALAVRLARDLPRLAELRRTLRARLEASPIMNAPRFARQIETAYRTMWRQWCAGKSFAPQ